MAKTREELNQLKTEYETIMNKLQELNENKLVQVIGGIAATTVSPDNTNCIQTLLKYMYSPKDKTKPQTCGNCTHYSDDKCMSGRGG